MGNDSGFLHRLIVQLLVVRSHSDPLLGKPSRVAVPHLGKLLKLPVEGCKLNTLLEHAVLNRYSMLLMLAFADAVLGFVLVCATLPHDVSAEPFFRLVQNLQW